MKFIIREVKFRMGMGSWRWGIKKPRWLAGVDFYDLGLVNNLRKGSLVEILEEFPVLFCVRFEGCIFGVN